LKQVILLSKEAIAIKFDQMTRNGDPVQGVVETGLACADKATLRFNIGSCETGFRADNLIFSVFASFPILGANSGTCLPPASMVNADLLMTLTATRTAAKQNALSAQRSIASRRTLPSLIRVVGRRRR
jgi:hypothetical protein